MAPLHETVSSVETLLFCGITVKLTTDQCWLHKGDITQLQFVASMMLYSILGKGVRKGEELKAPRYASAAVTRDYITTRDIIPTVTTI